jgi:hypothetical protein
MAEIVQLANWNAAAGRAQGLADNLNCPVDIVEMLASDVVDVVSRAALGSAA